MTIPDPIRRADVEIWRDTFGNCVVAAQLFLDVMKGKDLSAAPADFRRGMEEQRQEALRDIAAVRQFLAVLAQRVTGGAMNIDPSVEAYQHNLNQLAQDVLTLHKENEHMRAQLSKAYSLLSNTPSNLNDDFSVVHLWISARDKWLNEQIQGEE